MPLQTVIARMMMIGGALSEAAVGQSGHLHMQQLVQLVSRRNWNRTATRSF